MSDQDNKLEILPQKGYSRRAFLASSAAGVSALTLLETASTADAQSRSGKARIRVQSTPASKQQLPFLGDLAGWDKPEYYETLQAGRRHNGRSASHMIHSDFFDQGRDALLIRGPSGLLIHRFDAATGQWMQDVDGPPLTDPTFWFGSQYYSTIQTADIDGDEIAEILARAGDGLWVFKYDPTAQEWNRMPGSLAISDGGGWGKPEYYNTLQCADIDGDGRCELLGRGGDALYAWQYNTTTKNWGQIARLPDMSDNAGWNQPQQYNTICYGDFSGSRSDQVIARGPNGILAWGYDSGNDPNGNTFDPSTPSTPWPADQAWSDANGWNQPQYYSTIQSAYLSFWPLDAEVPTQSLVGRGKNGIEVWNWTGDFWNQAPFSNPILTDAEGWNKPEYYSTIQFTDIDGDGIEELIVRGPQGLQAWKVQNNGDGTGTWVALPTGPAWSDAAGWNQVQYYSTIQTSYPLQSGDPGALAKGQAVVLARNKDYVETWVYDPTAQAWSQTSQSSFPAFTGNQLTAYNYITTALGIRGTGTLGIRARYNDETGILHDWIADLLGTGIHPVSPPPNISSEDWNAVKIQILNELSWVTYAQDWYGTLTHQQIIDTFLGEDLTLYTIGPYLSYTSPQDNTALALSAVALILGALGAVLGLPALGVEIGVAAGTAASIAGVMSNTFSSAVLGLPGQGGSFTTDYSQLQQQLANGFNAALTKLGTQLFAMTGGQGSAGYVPGDYGLLSAIGQMIQSTIWSWPTDTTALTAAMQRGYAVEVWKVLFQAYQAKGGGGMWGYIIDTFAPNFIPSTYPTQYAVWYGPYQIEGGDSGNCNHWFGQGALDTGTFPPAATLHAQFDPPIEGQIFPLGVTPGDLFQGINGWPALYGFNIGLPTPPVNPPRKLPALGVDLRTSVSVQRDPATNQILVTLTHINRGLKGASNVEVTDLNLNLKRPVNTPPSRHKYIGPGKQYTHTFHFAAQPAGTLAVLRVSGRYLGGTFGASIRVKLP